MIKLALFVGAGGFLGSASRYLVQQASLKLVPAIPVGGTFLANIVGCIIIGIAMSGAFKLDKPWLVFLTSGFCGGFTTFSAFCFENAQFLNAGQSQSAMLYTAASVLIGLLATFGGLALGKTFI